MSDIQQHHTNLPPMYQNTAAPAVGLGEWIVTLIVLMIPLVNIIMLLVWAFSSGTNPSKANFCKAQLLLMLVSIVIAMVLFFGMGLGAAAMQQ
ncbi:MULTISPECIES: hypothetical protein [unclassified Neisseria]|uniref:hypothetical protein n=1 Tax=unclassified Neisseria TaxID=2623750 RepID=UPI0026665FD6|nr:MULTISPECIES: hypothetical protein [unclassified Neisseria]MDO1509470.1 hypothetical protein [Neisseria sp. MVDL19-042950]MDO1515757.1 hypothetical protein [Neisseria sp. MVDL18-041461]MDO1563419.1 hypothetical protein [Neisseria sp. MVDL20-010259]